MAKKEITWIWGPLDKEAFDLLSEADRASVINQIEADIKNSYDVCAKLPTMIVGLNIVLLRIIWEGCRGASKELFASNILSDQYTPYAKRKIGEICSGTWNNIYKLLLKQKQLNEIANTLGIDLEYFTPEQGKAKCLLNINSAEYGLLYRYYYFVNRALRGDNIKIKDDLCRVFRDACQRRLLYQRSHTDRGLLAEKIRQDKDETISKVERIQYIRETGLVEEQSDAIRWSEGRLLRKFGYQNLIEDYWEMDARREPRITLEKVMYFMRHLEVQKRQNFKRYILESTSNFEDVDFWNALYELVNQNPTDGAKEKMASLEKWERRWNDQLTMLRTMRILLASNLRKTEEAAEEEPGTDGLETEEME